jgi:hypothetical protein
MRRLLRALVVGWLVFVSLSVQAQFKTQCETCFDSEIIKVSKLSELCTAYEIKVYYNGSCTHDLSHISVEVPTCATVSNLSNDQNCTQVFGYDPTTDITGFKIENFLNFGSSSTKSFIISFTLCSSSNTCSALSCWSPVVAYKASTCFELDTLKGVCPKLQAHLVQKNVTCFGSSDGQLTVVVDNGVAPYQYHWSDSSSNSSLSNLSVGNYSVVVTDATGATVTLNATITQPSAITISPAVVNASCNGKADGSIQLSVSGGTGSYSYLWNTGATTSSLDSLKAGSYSVTVKDSSGCVLNMTQSVTNIKMLTLSATQQLPACNQSNGNLTVTPSGGTNPYHFKWSNGDTTSSINNLPAGNYSVVAIDAEGCSVSSNYSLRENNTLRISYTLKPTSCLDDSSGAIDISVTGGTQPYYFSWSNGATTEDLQNLSSGSYMVTVTDSLGCQVSAKITN